jgi:ring-1,2-phenylacetyl-CoA epoxidase subunit PaaD
MSGVNSALPVPSFGIDAHVILDAPVVPGAPAVPAAALANVSPDAIWTLLEAITDPEIPVVSLRELGILREVRWAGDGTGSIEVVITPTYSGCPAMGQIEDDVRKLLAANGIRARVVTQLAPVWTTDWMSDSARDKLLAYGIAPPRCSANDALQGGRLAGPADASVRVLQFAARPRMASSLSISVPCPQCRSDNTTETSHFGSTACKAMYRCLDCLEPFDYFKPY